MTLFTKIALAGIIGVTSAPTWAAPPTFPAAPGGADFPTTFPCGKTLVIPLVAEDSDGDSLSYTVETSNPLIMARVRSGNFHYKMQVHSDNDGTGAALDGEMEFQLYRGATPETAAFIAGYAQSGYYDNVLFHRVIPSFVIQGGDKAGTGSGTAPYSIRHEFRPELIYTGRGQLAMANSAGGYQQSFPANGNPQYRTGSFKPTNGSQFFVTLGQPRHLDFKHTLFGQLVRGFPTLDRIAAVSTDSTTTKPLTDVKMTTNAVTASRTDAVLLLSAKTTGTATVTVTARDSSGASASKAYNVNVVVDDTNDPPILLPFEPVVAPVRTLPNVEIHSFDLEHDAISTRFPVQDVFSGGNIIYAGVNEGNLNAVARPGAGAWDVTIGVTGLNDPLIDSDEFNSSRFETLEIGVGDRPVITRAKTVEAEAGTGTGSVVLATFRHGAAGAAPNDHIALVHWGDGSDAESNAGVNPTITITRSATEPGAFDVRGQHTYARPGYYPLHVTIDAPLGATETAKGWAAVSPQGAVIRAVGEEVRDRGPVFSGRPLAYFRDSTPGARRDDYTVTIDWGDGTRAPGTVRQAGVGYFAVVGTHRYADAEIYSTSVHIRRNGTNNESTAWGRIELTGFRGPEVLPPFSKANITSLWSQNPRKSYRRGPAGNLLGTDITGALFVLNGGDKPTGKWKLRFWISANNTLEPDLDKRVKVGPLSKQLAELSLTSLVPGAGGSLGLAPIDGGGDLTMRLPTGETGAGKYIIAELVYSDPITDKMKVPKTVPFGPLTGIIAERVTDPFVVKEEGGTSATFTVELDTLPTANVTVPLEIAVNGVVNTTRATLSTNELVFTPANGTTKQTVTVTAKDDGLFNPQTNPPTPLTIRLKAATSTDLRFHNMDATDVSLPIQDFPRNVVVTPTAVTVKEGAAVQTFKVRLQTLPDAPVSVLLDLVDANDNPSSNRATINKTLLTFTPTNGTLDQVVTVTPVDDDIANGNAALKIKVNPAVSESTSAQSYNGRKGSDVALTVQDNDAIGIAVNLTSLPLEEGGDARTFSVRLQSRPTSEVRIPLEVVNSNGVVDGSRMTLSAGELVFTPENATTAQVVTVTPVNDTEVNGTGTYTVRLKPAISADENTEDYHGRDAADVAVTITDDDTAGGAQNP